MASRYITMISHANMPDDDRDADDQGAAPVVDHAPTVYRAMNSAMLPT